ncbi:MAG TPA: mechanosensitive ion channel domain-containing protein [Gammaproteobacteria bacterium]|nr:mechanosensitive ion channel domain-containing protein [Gammaproteobacteria bacterium]
MTLTPYIPLFRGIIYLVAGFFIAKFASKGIGRLIQRQRKPRYTLLIKKIIFYVIFLLFIISALRQWGFELNVLLGATGIVTAAIALASQTVVSNIVSGFFLLGEDAFQLGDIIEINGIKGEIISIDSLSLKLKQADNTVVRIPHDLLIKNPASNLSHPKD